MPLKISQVFSIYENRKKISACYSFGFLNVFTKVLSINLSNMRSKWPWFREKLLCHLHISQFQHHSFFADRWFPLLTTQHEQEIAISLTNTDTSALAYYSAQLIQMITLAECSWNKHEEILYSTDWSWIRLEKKNKWITHILIELFVFN